jgi:hypothetical protein
MKGTIGTNVCSAQKDPRTHRVPTMRNHTRVRPHFDGRPTYWGMFLEIPPGEEGVARRPLQSRRLPLPDVH